MTINSLEQVRKTMENKDFLDKFVKNIDNKTAINIFNTEKISFVTFYQLIPHFEKQNLIEKFPRKYNVTHKILNNNIENIKENDLYNAQKWIFSSAVNENYFTNDYDEIIDNSANSLLHDFKDYSILNDVCTLIFMRNRKNLYNHDLLRTYLMVNDKNNIKYIINMLKSSDITDVDFARELLDNFNTENTKIETFSAWNNWYNENSPYLFYTNENFQQTSNPSTYKIDLKSKYLQKSITNNRENDIFSIKEQEKLKEIENIAENDVLSVCHYTHLVKNYKKKSDWTALPINDRIRIANKHFGGSNNA